VSVNGVREDPRGAEGFDRVDRAFDLARAAAVSRA
jgi:hypothetical protein